MKTPNYALIEDYTYKCGNAYDSRTIKAGTFVSPISERWLPKHVLDDTRWTSYNVHYDVFCYTADGIIPIPRKIIKEKK